MFDLSKFMIGPETESQKSDLEVLPAQEADKTEPAGDMEEPQSPQWSDNDLQSWPDEDLQVPNISNTLPQQTEKLPVQNLPDKIPVCPTESDTEPEPEPEREKYFKNCDKTEDNFVPHQTSEQLNEDLRSEDSYLPVSEKLFSPVEVLRGGESSVKPPSSLSSPELLDM